MLDFLQPIWLWATAGIIVPVIIHLWNIKQGKTLKVGSIALFTKNAKSSAKSLQLSQLLLLLLRCLLLISLAMLIAKPVWKEQATTKEKGWILIKKNEVQDAYKAYHPMIDTLLKQGYSFHYFDKNCTAEKWQNALLANADTATEPSLSYWSLLKILNDTAPRNLPVYLFTDNQLQHFQGNRPEINLPLKWYTFTTPDTTSAWLENAYETANDSIKLISGKSSYNGTYFTWQNLSLINANNNYTVEHNNAKWLIKNNDSFHQTIEADTSAKTVIIYANQFTDDANYVKAAINSISDFTQQKIKVITTKNVNTIPADFDWLFWLSTDKIPSSEIKKNVFSYENGEPARASAALFAGDNTALTAPENISLYKYNTSNSTSFQTIWKNGFDEPVLSRQNGKANLYYFYSRFNPQWNDLVWNHSFPQLLYKLIFEKGNDSDSLIKKDKRIIDSSQLQAAIKPQPGTLGSNKNAITERDISQLIWLIAFMLFTAERILSFSIKKEKL